MHPDHRLDHPMDDEPRPEHDDGYCITAGCPRRAEVREGRLVSYCVEHRAEYLGWPIGYTEDEIDIRPNVVTSLRLSLRERAWLPQNAREQSREWPSVTKVEAFAGCFVHQLDGGYAEDAWTWRSVAMAARAFPDRIIRLVGSELYIPQLPNVTAAPVPEPRP